MEVDKYLRVALQEDDNNCSHVIYPSRRLLQRLGLSQVFLVKGIQSSLCRLHKRLSSCQVSLTAGLELTHILCNDRTFLCFHLRCLILQIDLGFLNPDLNSRLQAFVIWINHVDMNDVTYTHSQQTWQLHTKRKSKERTRQVGKTYHEFDASFSCCHLQMNSL